MWTGGVVVDKCPVDVEAIKEPLELLLGGRREPVYNWHHLQNPGRKQQGCGLVKPWQKMVLKNPLQ